MPTCQHAPKAQFLKIQWLVFKEQHYTISTTSHVKFTTKKGSQTYQTFPTANLTGSLVVSSSFSGILGNSTPLQLGNWFKDRGLQPSFAQLAAFTLTAAQLKDGRSFEKWGYIYTMLYYVILPNTWGLHGVSRNRDIAGWLRMENLITVINIE